MQSILLMTKRYERERNEDLSPGFSVEKWMGNKTIPSNLSRLSHPKGKQRPCDGSGLCDLKVSVLLGLIYVFFSERKCYCWTRFSYVHAILLVGITVSRLSFWSHQLQLNWMCLVFGKTLLLLVLYFKYWFFDRVPYNKDCKCISNLSHQLLF